MTFWYCFGLQWTPNFGDYHDWTCLSCFDNWLCILHTLTQMCLIIPCTCITYAHLKHTLAQLSIVLHFSTYNMIVWKTAPPTNFYRMLGQTYVNGWSRIIVSQNGGSTSYISPLRLGVLQWRCHLFNYWKNKKTIIKKFLILLIWNWIYINHRKITLLWS